MTKQAIFNHTGHKALWHWLANNPRYKKEDWPGWCENGGTYRRAKYYCFACGAAGGITKCHLCPLDWGGYDIYSRRLHCMSIGSVYRRWFLIFDGIEAKDEVDEGMLCERVQYARQIRDLPIDAVALDCYEIF